MQQKSESPATSGIVRAVIGALLLAWGFYTFGQGPALAGYLHTLLGMEAGPAVGLAFGLELTAVLAGFWLIEPFLARLQAAWRE